MLCNQATEDLRPGAHQDVPIRPVDPWVAVEAMSRSYVRQGKSSHHVPNLNTLGVINDNNNVKILEKLLGPSLLDKFLDAFEEQDRHGDGSIDTDGQAVDAFHRLGADISASEIRIYLKTAGNRSLKFLSFTDFVLAFANLLYPTGHGLISATKESEYLARTLRIDGEWSDLGAFARSFGKKQLQELERAFDAVAATDAHGVSRLHAKDVLETFHRLGRAVTISRLQEWMLEAGGSHLSYIILFCIFLCDSVLSHSILLPCQE